VIFCLFEGASQGNNNQAAIEGGPWGVGAPVVTAYGPEQSSRSVRPSGIDNRARRVAHFRRVDTTRCLRSHRGYGERIEPLQASSPLPERTRQQRKRLASPVRSSRGTTDARFSRREGYGADAPRSPHSQVRIPHSHRELGTRRPDAGLSRLERAERQDPVRERGRSRQAGDDHPGKRATVGGWRRPTCRASAR
jgi:hypothetical protein